MEVRRLCSTADPARVNSSPVKLLIVPWVRSVPSCLWHPVIDRAHRCCRPRVLSEDVRVGERFFWVACFVDFIVATPRVKSQPVWNAENNSEVVPILARYHILRSLFVYSASGSGNMIYFEKNHVRLAPNRVVVLIWSGHLYAIMPYFMAS